MVKTYLHQRVMSEWSPYLKTGGEMIEYRWRLYAVNVLGVWALSCD